MYDVIILGKGPAGISAALYTARAGLSTLVISKGWGSLEKADKIQNYYNSGKLVTGIELLESGVNQAVEFGVEFADDEVVAMDGFDGINVTGVNSQYKGKSLILAVGAPKRKPNFKNLDKYEGRGISYCSACDGFFYRDSRVGLVGFNEYMAYEARELKEITGDVTILTNGQPLALCGKGMEDISGLPVDEEKIKGFYGDEMLEGIEFESGRKEAFDGVFIAYGSASALEMALKAGLVMENGSIVTDCEKRTNIPGIFAAGDCTGGFKQIAVAVGEGAVAAKSAIEYVRTLG